MARKHSTVYSSFVNVQLRPADKAKLVKQAEKAGLTLSAYVRLLLTKRAGLEG